MTEPTSSSLSPSAWVTKRDGRLETTAEFEARLQEATGLGGLFAESLAEAYRVMNRKKAFRRDPGEDAAEY